MKKFMMIIVTILSCMICSVVLADASPPSLSERTKAVVSNANGTKVYEYDDARVVKDELKYGDTITTWGNWDSINAEYISVTYGNDYNGYGWVLKKDLKKEDWTFDDLTFTNAYEEERVVLDERGIDIHEWLTEDSKVIGHIPSMTTIRFKHPLEDYMWGYITYNGVSGWIYTMDSKTGYKGKGTLMINWRGAIIRDYEGSALKEIPANTVLTNFYNAYGRVEGDFYYVTYEGVSGYIASNYWDIDKCTTATSSRNYYSVDYEGAILIGTDNTIISVPYGAFLEYEISSENQIFTSYNRKEGWVFKLPYYYDEESKQRSVEQVNEWITKATTYVQNRKNNTNETPEPVVEKTKAPIITEQPIETNTAPQEVVSTPNEKTFPLTEMVLISVLCALIASITTAVIVVLINKKKQK